MDDEIEDGLPTPEELAQAQASYDSLPADVRASLASGMKAWDDEVKADYTAAFLPLLKVFAAKPPEDGGKKKLGESLSESILRLLERGPAPRPGLVFNDQSHHWERPDGSEVVQAQPLDLSPDAKEKVASALERATLRVAAILYKIDRLVPAVRAALEGIFDTEEDLAKGYYRPSTGTGGGNAAYDVAAEGLGVSTNTLGLILTRAVPFVLAKAMTGRKTMEEEAKGGADTAAALLAEIFAAIAEELGFPDAMVVNTDAIRKMIADRVAQ